MEIFISDNYPLVFYPGVFTQPNLLLDSHYALALLKKGFNKFKNKHMKQAVTVLCHRSRELQDVCQDDQIFKKAVLSVGCAELSQLCKEDLLALVKDKKLMQEKLQSVMSEYL